ncbi:adenine nucleotide alpha hydrolase [Acidobacteria bacterium AH-259-D05]|nr:adenine nucleotide alpha hydrolase [Acidobacteria bacterium AH-259-D05]
MKKVWLAWSSGKDSAWTLHRLREQGKYDVVSLFTTVNEAFDRVAMHAVRTILLEAQARTAGLPLRIVPLAWPCSNADYETIMAKIWVEAVQAGVEAIAFGDLFLEDVREYRLNLLKETGLEAIFPLWQSPTRHLAELMISSGLRAKLTCIDPKQLSPGFVGRDFDPSLLRDLPLDVDPCGENGEFHSFVYAGPMFAYPLKVSVREVTERDGFVFADVVPLHRSKSD